MQVNEETRSDLLEIQAAIKLAARHWYATAEIRNRIESDGSTSIQFCAWTEPTDFLVADSKQKLLERISLFDPAAKQAKRIAELRAELAKLEAV